MAAIIGERIWRGCGRHGEGFEAKCLAKDSWGVEASVCRFEYLIIFHVDLTSFNYLRIKKAGGIAKLRV